MKAEHVALAERLVWLAGFVALVVALAAVDWRAGLFAAGVILLSSSVDWRIPR